MLDHIEMGEYSKMIEEALSKTLCVKEQTTADLGGKASTEQFTHNIIKNLN
jgi:isocitrate dehydrogenase (NAD+)